MPDDVIPGIADTALEDAPPEVPELEEPGTETPVPEGGDAPPEETKPEDKAPEEEGGEKPGESDEAAKAKDIDVDLAKIKDPKERDIKVRDAINALKKTQPNVAKMVADSYFGRRAYEKEFATVQDARQARAVLDSVGGADGIEELNTEVTDWRNEADQFANAAPELVASLYDSNPEAVVANALNIMELLERKNPTHFEAALLPSFVRQIDKSGLPTALVKLADLIKEGKGQESYDLVANLAAWVKNVKDNVEKLGRERDRERVDPREREYQEKARALDEREQQNYISDCQSQAEKLNWRSMGDVAGAFMKDMKFDAEGKREFMNLLNSAALRIMGQDKTYLRTVKAIREKKDAKRTAEFINGKFAEVVPEAFRQLRNRLYPNSAPFRKPAAGQKPNGTGKKPDAPQQKAVPGKVYEKSQVDIQSTPDLYLVTGKAYLKGTKTLVPYNRG